MSVTLAKRLVAIILLVIGVPVRNAVKLIGLCEKSMWFLKKKMQEASVQELIVIKAGSGRKVKATDIEKQILAELEAGNYYTRQQIVDMIEEKFHVTISKSAVGRL